MTATIHLPADEAADITRTPGITVAAAQLPLFEFERPIRIRLQLTGTITLPTGHAAPLARKKLGALIDLTDLIDQAYLVKKTYTRSLDQYGYPNPLEQTITLKIIDPSTTSGADDNEEE